MTDRLYLRRVDPDKNMSRFYVLAIEPNLFGEFSLVREWGRIGKGGQVKQASFGSVEEARQACKRLATAKQRRGYFQSDDRLFL